MKVTILDDWFDTLRTLPCFDRLAGHDVTVFTDHLDDVDALAARLADTEALVLFRERTPITRSLMERLPRLKLISLRGSYPHVDVAACAEHGVTVCSNLAAGKPSYPTAELTFALMLAALRGLPSQMASLRGGHWQAGVGRGLRGKTLALFGYGRIGQVVAELGQAFGMHLLIWGSESGRKRAAASGLDVAESQHALFSQADIVSLHLKLTPATRGIVTQGDLAAMGPRSLLVNTSRAGLIAPGVLLQALEAGRPGMAALDVFDDEPVTDPSDPLISHPRVIATPHIGFVTEEELDMQFADIFDQINRFDMGAPINVVTPAG